jgi:hypothetical protein
MTVFAGLTCTPSCDTALNDTWVLTQANGIALAECSPSGGECEQENGEGEHEDAGMCGTNGKHNNDFSFIVRRPLTTHEISGRLQYVNHASRTTVQSVAFSLMMISGNTGTFAGTCTKNGVPCTFIVSMRGNGATSAADAFAISVDGGREEGGKLCNGTIQVFPRFP